MIKIGKFNRLKVLRDADFGIILGDDSGDEVLLPHKYCSENLKIDDEIKVFIYLDRNNRTVATTVTPMFTLHEFAYLKAEAVTASGAFMDWGLDKHLFVPLVQQKEKIEEGKHYFIYMLQDNQTGKLYGTSKIERYFKYDTTSLKVSDEVELQIYDDAGIGFSVIVDNRYRGMVYKNEVYQDLRIGNKLPGYIKNIREDNRIDVSLQPIGYKNFNTPNSDLIMQKLKENSGFLHVTDKSQPEEIHELFGISKKAFKRAVGSLYKQHKVELLKDGIQLSE